MSSVKYKYEEGTWFLVPLYGYGFVAGVVARASISSKGILLGYFFSEVYAQPPKIGALCKLKPSEACEALVFGDRGLKRGEWPIIGKCADWFARDWGMPNFVRTELLSGRRYEVFYDANDPAKKAGERELKAEECKDLKQDSLFGHIAVQRYISHILGHTIPALDIDDLQGKLKK